MNEQHRFSAYQHSEAVTGGGCMVQFTCAPGDVDMVREFLATHVRSIERPKTGRIRDLEGNEYGYSRYDVIRHKQAGARSGEIRVLEIKDPPDGRWGIVIEMFDTQVGHSFTEWDTLEQACAAFESHWGTRYLEEELPKCEGFRRYVACGDLTPWFLAMGDEQLVGDYTFPDGLQDDPVFRFGKRFIVLDHYDRTPMIKTCMGTRFMEQMVGLYPQRKERHRLVYWHDGDTWDERDSRSLRPRALEGGEFWITEALQKFVRLLLGKCTEFCIDFTNGDRFIGKLERPKGPKYYPEGRYDLVVHLKGKPPRKGWYEFKPAPEVPDLVQSVTQRYIEQGAVVERIEVEQCKTTRGGKKWAGVFFSPNS